MRSRALTRLLPAAVAGRLVTDAPALSRRGFFAVVLGVPLALVGVRPAREEWRIVASYGKTQLVPSDEFVRLMNEQIMGLGEDLRWGRGVAS